MKKTYESPSVEKIAFQYRDQVVVASGGSCTANYTANEDAAVGNCNHESWTGNNTAWN